MPCPVVEWNGRDPWFEVQSRNLLRRHLAKEQICAIRKIAAEQYPELAETLMLARTEALMKPVKLKDQSSVGTSALNDGVMPPGNPPTRGTNGDGSVSPWVCT